MTKRFVPLRAVSKDPALGAWQSYLPGREPVLTLDLPTVPVSRPDIGLTETHAVLETLMEGWISSKAPVVKQLEEEFADRVGARFGVAVNSGTSALILALAALELDPDDFVSLPTFTMVATAFAVSHRGQRPEFCDVDDYYNLPAADYQGKVWLPVHMYGHPVDMDEMEDAAVERQAVVIYDAAEAHGALYKDKPIGGRGLASCYSFYANKICQAGEGGMITTNDEEFAALCANMRDMCFSPERHFWHRRLGYNFRMTGLQAAVALAQTYRMDELVSKHRELNAYYQDHLGDLVGLEFQPQAPWATSACWMNGITINEQQFGCSRDMVRQELGLAGIETRSYFIPMHWQPCYAWDPPTEHLEKSEQLCRDGLYLPSASNLTEVEKRRVVEAVLRVREKYDRK